MINIKSTKFHGLVFSVMAIFAPFYHGCTGSSFTGGSAVAGKSKPPTPPTPPVTPKDANLSAEKKIEPIQNNKIWTATFNTGVIAQYILDGDKLSKVKTWSFTPDSSHGGVRTYVTEGGFLAAQYPWIYYVDADAPAGAVTDKVKTNAGAEERICLASYMKDNKRFIVAAFGSGSFIIYPMEDVKPFRPLFSQGKPGSIKLNAGEKWGYSCFIDQAQKIFYSQWNSGGVYALDMNTLQKVEPMATVANANFVSNTISNLQLAKTASRLIKGAYALSGDPYGNLYNAAGTHTIAYDKASDSIWMSMKAHTGGNIKILPRECFTKEPNCSGIVDYPVCAGAGASCIPQAIAALSPLKDGRVAGVSRTGVIPSQVYLFSLKDPKNRAGGINITRLTNDVLGAGGDTYMYNDFTGATLYINESEQTIDLTQIQGYSAGKTITGATFMWKPTTAALGSNLSMEWQNIKIQARCYTNAGSKGDYADVSKINSSDKVSILDVPSCIGKAYAFVDIKLTQVPGFSSLAGVESIQAGFLQKK